MTINKTLTKKLKKGFQNRGVYRDDLYIGKSGAGLYYVGRAGKDVVGFPKNIFISGEDAIEAALNGFRPEVIHVGSDQIHTEE